MDISNHLKNKLVYYLDNSYSSQYDSQYDPQYDPNFKNPCYNNFTYFIWFTICNYHLRYYFYLCFFNIYNYAMEITI